MLPTSRLLIGDCLAATLYAYDVPFVNLGDDNPATTILAPVAFLAGLADAPEARLRLALIPLLLVHPELAATIPAALTCLSAPAQATLKLFYTAAQLLQQHYRSELDTILGVRPELPDQFSSELVLPPLTSPEQQLIALGERHGELTGLCLNWVGSYHHAARRLLKRVTFEAQWNGTAH